MESKSNEGVFQMATKVQKWGNSLGIRIPQQVVEKLGISNGSMMELTANGQHIILTPVESKPTLEELLSKVTDENRHAEVDFGIAKGNELW